MLVVSNADCRWNKVDKMKWNELTTNRPFFLPSTRSLPTVLHFLVFSLVSSEVSDEKQSEESQPCCSDAHYQSAVDDDECQSTSDSKYHCDSQYQCSTGTKYQSIYVMSDQKDECIIATEVRSTSKPIHVFITAALTFFMLKQLV